MASSNELKYWELSQGGRTGSMHLDASVATATATGLQCGFIDVISTAVFTILTGTSVLTTSAVDFRVENGLSGLSRGVGDLWPGYGRHFTSIQITSGQIAYYEKRNN